MVDSIATAAGGKPKKNGPITQEEKDFIRLNMQVMSAKDIADELGRNPNTILSFMNSIDGNTGEKGSILNLKKREDWAMIKSQFSEDEIVLFEYHWAKICEQFREEIRYTESLQLLNAIKHEILGNRALTDQRKLTIQIGETEKKLDKERDKPTQDVQRIESLERLLGSLSAALEMNNKEYRECNKKLSEALTALKGSREQRLARVEDSKKSFNVWMARLISDKDLQKDLGQYAEKHKLAAELERQRLGRPFKFADGKIDRPLLNEDTLDIEYDVNLLDEKKEDTEDEN